MLNERAIRLWRLDPEHGHAPWRGRPDRRERVLHVHLATPEEPQTSLCKALASLGGSDGYRRVDWTALPFADRQRAVLDAAAAQRPTLVFMQLQTSGVLAASTVAELRRTAHSPELVIISWCGDVGGENGPFPAAGD